MILELIERLWKRPCSNTIVIELDKVKKLSSQILSELDTRTLNEFAAQNKRENSVRFYRS